MRLHFPSSYRSSSSWEKLGYKRGVTEEPAAKIWNFHSQGEEPREESDLPPPSGPALVVSRGQGKDSRNTRAQDASQWLLPERQ